MRTRSLWLTALSLTALALIATLAAASWLWSTAGNAGLQSLGSWLSFPMQVFTFLGDEQFYLIAIPIVYWCIHKGLGADLGIMLVLSSYANGLVKSLIKHPRPFWQAPELQLGEAGSFSTPSGHAQNSAALFGYLAVFLAGKRRGGRWIVLLALVIVLVCLSRVYLGVHFAGDVLWGAASGLVLVALYAWAKPRLLPRLRGLPLGLHALLALIAGGAVLASHALVRMVAMGSGPDFPQLYGEALTSTVEDTATVAGLAIGLWFGLALESRHVRFSVAGPVWQRVVRYVVGVAILFSIWMGLRTIFPQEPLALGLTLRIVRYALAMFWAIAGWPWVFVRLGLGEREGNRVVAERLMPNPR